MEHDVKSLCCLPILLVTLVLFGLLQYEERLEREKFLQDLQKRIVNCPVSHVFCSLQRFILPSHITASRVHITGVGGLVGKGLPLIGFSFLGVPAKPLTPLTS